jgi:hypothetical protein
MANQEWVEKHALSMLKKMPNETAKTIQINLIADYNIYLPYHIVSKGKKKSLKSYMEISTIASGCCTTSRPKHSLGL